MQAYSVAAAQTPLWSEEFNSGSAPDSEVWSYDLGAGGWGNSELQTYTDDAANVRVEGGHLIITAERQGNSFTSARVKTQDKLTFTYGTVEARIQIPDLGSGLWPAFWTLGNTISRVGWPACGEIDVMEMGISGAINAGAVNRRVGSAAHWENNNSHASYGLYKDMASDIHDTFVVYRMEWTPTEIKTYINDQWIWTMGILEVDMEEFHEPHFFLLNLAVGGNYTGITNPDGIAADFPAEYKIDYIRLYDNGDTVLGGSSTVAPPVPGANLLANAGFESGTTGWDRSLSGGTASESAAYARSGDDALVINSTGAGGWSSPNVSQTFSANPGDVFNMQGYMLNPGAHPIAGGSFGLFKIEFRSSSGAVLAPASVDIGTSALPAYPGAESTPKLNASSALDSWILSEVQAEAPAGTTEVNFYMLNVNDPDHAGPMYFDDVQAMLVGNPPVFAADSIATASAVATAAYTGASLAGDATDPDDDPLSYSLIPGGPVWLNVATDGALSGTPDHADAGLNSWGVQVSDGNGGIDSATLEITVVPVLFPVLSSSIREGNIQIRFPTQNGVRYDVAYKSSLTNEQWIPVETIIGDGSTKSPVYPVNDPVRFYRILTP